MVGYSEIFPLAPALAFSIGSERWLAVDDYCVNPDCDCRQVVLQFVTRAHERGLSLGRKKSPPAIFYDYLDGTFEKAQATQAHQPSLQALLSALKDQRPRFDGEMKRRHKRLQALFKRARSQSEAAAESQRTQDSAPEPPPRTEPATVRSPKPGRNTPCPCGSGKKYKKCCLPKDEGSRHQKDMEPVEAVADRQSTTGTTETTDAKAPKPAPDPHVEACETRWSEFEAAEYEDRLELFVRTLDDADLMDEEMAFEMLNEIFCASAKRGDRDRFDELVERLRERRPDVYAKDKSYFFKWRITNELVAGRTENVPILMRELASIASKNIDIFERVESQVAYHGHLTTLVEAMRLSWAGVKSSSDIVPWGIDEFCQRAITYEVLNHADSISRQAGSDLLLAERIKSFSQIDAAQVDSFLAHITEWPGRTWTMSDFQFAPPRHPWKDDEDDEKESESDQPGGELNFYHLTVQFLGYLRRFEGVPFAKGELARRELHRFIRERHDGKLEFRESMLDTMKRDLDRKQGRRCRPIRRFKTYEHLLVPDPERLEHYLAGLLGMMNQLFHRAGALFEIIPPWLRFLESRRLIDAETRVRALDDLSPQADELRRLYDTFTDDPFPRLALESWRENARKAVPE